MKRFERPKHVCLPLHLPHTFPAPDRLLGDQKLLDGHNVPPKLVLIKKMRPFNHRNAPLQINLVHVRDHVPVQQINAVLHSQIDVILPFLVFVAE